jgi:hypothetical protein
MKATLQTKEAGLNLSKLAYYVIDKESKKLRLNFGIEQSMYIPFSDYSAKYFMFALRFSSELHLDKIVNCERLYAEWIGQISAEALKDWRDLTGDDLSNGVNA